MSKRLDLTGQRFTRLLVIEFAYVKNQATYWRCLCDCGNTVIVCCVNLKGSTKSCGCLRKEKHSKERRRVTSESLKGRVFTEKHKRKISEAHRGKNIIDLTGKRFGRLIVKEEAGRNKQDRITWLCKCDCGNEKVIAGHDLQNGGTKSCGCYKEELMFREGKNNSNYNTNLTDEERQLARNIPGYTEWRKAILKRDNHKCVICGSKKNLIAHHLESYNSNPKLRTKLSNGTTVCEKHHKDFHHIFGYGNNTKKQFIQFKEEHDAKKTNK
ncbi:hypothetical protein KAW18_12675 [candidate division WOR-3 bacterium]|nr:hypothetical protein [candidate division WOR-3 bacterium]